jgi:mannose-6-phosphate isomerase-like protein (cupin superfamily)
MKSFSMKMASLGDVFISGMFSTSRLLRIAVVPLLGSLLSVAPMSVAAAESAVPSGDQGRRSWVVDIEKLTLDNSRFRASWWTGKFLQMTVMSIPPGGEIGLEKHDVGDQFIRVEQGRARVVMGPSEDQLTYEREVGDDWAIFIPAGAWHNIINVGKEDLKVYVIYAPPEHPAGTLHETFEESEAEHAE